jgi:hypothetical protein
MTERSVGTQLRPSDSALKILFEQASNAVEESICNYSIGIIFGAEDRHLDMATGVAISWKRRRLIVTAKHSFRPGDENKQLTLILPRNRPLNRADVTPLPPLDLDCLLQVSAVPIVRCEWEDLAYFEVGDGFGSRSDLEFYELSESAVCPPTGTQCLLSGFPNDLSGQIASSESLANLANRWSEICNPEDNGRFLKNFDAQFHFLMKFHKANKGTQPEGFSGGGIWFALSQNSDSPIWHSVPGLSGIQSRWFPKSSLTLAVRVEYIVQFLRENIK